MPTAALVLAHSVAAFSLAGPRTLVPNARSCKPTMMANDAQEGICAFLEKRKPEWQDS